jgi:DNA invertase Pin-like site-specific DNA recombinase
MNAKISADHLKRRAIVYIRQSSPGQVIHNQESQRRQYGLADHARQLGFHRVEIIDEDLGRSGSGQVERPGFEHLVAEVCTGEVGAVLCIEASRLARNGRDWHHLIELCGLVHAVVIAPDGIYDPGILNDRLLLGLNRPDTQSTSYSTSGGIDAATLSFALDVEGGLRLFSPSRLQI